MDWEDDESKENKPLLSDPANSWRWNILRSKSSYFSWKWNLYHHHQALLWLFAFIIYFFIILCVILVYYDLPSPVGDDSKVKFSEVRARIHLEKLVNAIGPRSIGTVKNMDTLHYLLGELEKIRNGSYDENGNPRITYGVRNHLGNSLMYHSKKTLWWKDMNNVVAILHGKSNDTNAEKFLISSHYDTVTLSPGAFDDSSGVSILLELLFIFSNLPKMENDLVVLFNNGEEAGLIGAMDFAGFDELFNKCVGFINIDSTPGWKPVLFRSTGSWLDFVFSKVPRPFGSVLAQDLFNLKFVNSDTDFTIYSQDGHPGLDFAFFGHRQTYHTLKDTTLPNGALQFHGENLFTILEFVLNRKNLRSEIESNKEQNVYFDVLNLFAVVYSIRIGFIIHCILAACFILFLPMILRIHYLWWRCQPLATRSQINPCVGTLYEFLKILLSVIVGLSLSYLVGILIKQFNPKFYRSSVSWAVCTFLFSTMAGICMVQFVFSFVLHVRGYPLSLYSHMFWAVGAFWGILVIGTLPLAYWMGSTYLIFYPGAFAFIGLILHYIYEHIFFMKSQKPKKKIKESEQEESIFQRKTGSSSSFKKEPGALTGGRPPFGHFFIDSDHSETDSEPLRSGDDPLVDSDEDSVEEDSVLYEPLPSGIRDYIFLLFLFFFTTVPPFLMLFSVFFIVLLHLTSDFSCDFTGIVISIFTVIGFLNFYPLSKKANCFGVLAIIFSLGAILCILFAGFWFSPTPASPYVVGISQIRQDSNSSTLSFYGLPDVPSLENFLKKDLEIMSTIQCSGTRCYSSEKILPEIKGMNFSATKTNEGVTIVFDTPGAYVQEVSLMITGGMFKNISVNNHLIATSTQSIDFTYFFPQDTSWVLALWLNNTWQSQKVIVNVASHYNDLKFSPAIQNQIKNLPPWATFIGTGSGLTVSSSNLQF